MREAKKEPDLWRRLCRAVFRSRSVCPQCGARVRQGRVYFMLACILIGLGAGMVGQHIVSLQWQSVITELKHDIEQPFPRRRAERHTTKIERHATKVRTPQDGEPEGNADPP